MIGKPHYAAGIAAVALCLVSSSSAAASRLSYPSPSTLVAGKDIAAFAQDGTRIAWLDRSKCASVFTRDLATGSTRPLVANARLTCNAIRNADESGEALHEMALSGTRAVWGALAVYWGNEEEGWDKYVFTAAPGETEHQLDSWGSGVFCDHTEVDSCGFGGTSELVAAADGTTVFYVNEGSYSEWSDTKPSRVYRVERRKSLVPSSRDALRIDAAGGRLAILLNASGPRTILVQTIAHASTVSRFAVSHGATEVALDGSMLGVRILDKVGSRLELRRINGVRIRSAAVPRSAENFSLAGGRVVYSVGKSIYLLEASTGKSALLARAVRPIAGLSIEGRRVAWLELGRGIFAVALP